MCFHYLYSFILTILCTQIIASEAELFVELETIKNEVKVQGYSSDTHDKILRLYDDNKGALQSYSNPSLKKELIGLVRSSVLVQKLKDCVDTGHDRINQGIDALFISAVTSGCIGEIFSDEKITELTTDTDKILDVVQNEAYNPDDLRKDLFDKSLPGLLESFNRSRSKFEDTDPKFMVDDDKLFPMLPESKRHLRSRVQEDAPTYAETSTTVLGPIKELYEEVYGDQAQSALSDQWKDVYTPKENSSSPHLFGSGLHNRNESSVQNEVENCLEKVERVKELQQEAKNHFSHLKATSFQLGLTGIIQEDSKLDETYEQLGFATEPKCVSLRNSYTLSTPNMDRFGPPLSQEQLGRGLAEKIAISGDHVALTLGELGSDPNNVYKPIRRETLDTRSYLAGYTEDGIKESHTKALEGMLGFINHMGRRVYDTKSDSTGENLLNFAGDTAQTLTSLGDSTQVDIALLLMANPAQGMQSLIENPLALNAFCDSFKALRNQDNVNTVIEIASALSMFTGVGGMLVKGTTLIGRGLRVSNMALAGADTLSIVDSMTHARDLALASACEQGSESLCQSYLDSDRNMTLAIAGLALSGMGSVAGASNLTKRLRSAFLLRNGNNAQGIVRDNQKIISLLDQASDAQKSSILRIINSRQHSDEEVMKLVSLIQNNENGKTLEFLDKFNQLDEQTKQIFIQRLLNKVDDAEGGACVLPS